MKFLLLPVTFISFVLGIALFWPKPVTAPVPPSENIAVCGPVYSGISATTADGKFIVALPGWGHYSYPVTVKSDSAQFYFDQGLSMYYSYHFKEAVASFRESERLEKSNPMALWGQALAMGPYYNAAHSYTKPEGLAEVLKRMNEEAMHASPKEKQLIEAMNSRYSSDRTDADRPALNLTYSQKIKALMSLYPDDQDIKVLYIDAIMLMHAWDFWNKDGTSNPWTPELVSVCEKVLKNNPKHPAALHYYIHLTEASRHPDVSLAGAETLRDLLPGVAHMVHMSSHAYERSGLYNKGVEVNNLADDNLLYYDLLAKNLALNKHSSHYFAVQSYCALSAGMYAEAMRYAQRCHKSVAPTAETTYDQYLYMIPVMTLVRMGKWEQILEDSIVPDHHWTYASLLSDFAKGIALVNTGQIDSASTHLDQLRIKMKDPVLTKRRIPFNSPIQVAEIAENILNATILFARNERVQAISSHEKAVKLEDKLIYTEPKDWPIPARQFLGAYLLKAGKPAEAQKVYVEDLIFNPGNGWSLLGLYQSVQAQGKRQNLAAYKAKYQAAFAHSDKIPSSSVFMK
jgi:tetratricopeptide (TPR) repeat protein